MAVSARGFSTADHEYMARALRLAEKGRYTTHPNPRVGCVLVRDGKILGEGWHRRAGQPHAEPLAIRAAGGDARGSTAYVTLEPCCHQGRTPPCTQALIEAGVSRVIVAMTDPNPLVAGKGLRRLQQAGIETRSGLLEDEARRLNPGFVKRMTQGLPWVRCKLAMSLDGRTAMASGESAWITGAQARRDVQRLRAECGAILTGSGTLLADDPSLNVRISAAELGIVDGGEPLQPLRVVLDSRLRTPVQARLFTLPGKTLICYGRDEGGRGRALRAAGAELLQLEYDDTGLDMKALLSVLASREINEVLIEAGARVAGSALQSGLLDEIIVYLAPHLMGDGGHGLFHLPGLDSMQDRVPLAIEDVRAVGRDFRLRLRPASAVAVALPESQ